MTIHIALLRAIYNKQDYHHITAPVSCKPMGCHSISLYRKSYLHCPIHNAYHGSQGVRHTLSRVPPASAHEEGLALMIRYQQSYYIIMQIKHILITTTLIKSTTGIRASSYGYKTYSYHNSKLARIQIQFISQASIELRPQNSFF